MVVIMVLEGLSGPLRDTLKRIANATHIDKSLIKDVVRDIQRALLRADVNVKMVLELTKAIEKRSLTEKPPPGMSSREHVIRIVYDELVNILGETTVEFFIHKGFGNKIVGSVFNKLSRHHIVALR